MMVISLYTSRVILKVLGIEDYGVYQVVGGLVTMFAVVSSSLSAATSRFITFEIGSGNKERLKKIFSTSLIIQFGISLVVLIIAEIVGIWFMQTQMQIPDGRMMAAHWVFQCSLITFCINLISIPYNACIIAHEHMKAFAYVSVIEVVLKLLICFLIAVSPVDRLISYAILLTFIAVTIRLIYTYYCHKHFEESRTKLVFDKQILKEMFGFAGWSFFSNTASIFNNQGVNMLINVFFGVTVNAARGIANQVEGAVLQFVNNFTMAVNPQITKSYAVGDKEGMHSLVCRSAKFSYFAMFIMALPIICEAENILSIWLTVVPEHTVIFAQLSLIMGMLDSIGSSGFAACMATGSLKRYALVITSIGFLEFPLTWLFFAYGAPVVSTYYLYIFVKVTVLIARMLLMRNMIGLKPSIYVSRVFVPIILTTIAAIIPALLVVHFMPHSIIRLLISVAVGVISVVVAALFIGMTINERTIILEKAANLFSRLRK